MKGFIEVTYKGEGKKICIAIDKIYFIEELPGNNVKIVFGIMLHGDKKGTWTDLHCSNTVESYAEVVEKIRQAQ